MRLGCCRRSSRYGVVNSEARIGKKQHNLRAKESGVFGVRAQAGAHLDSHGWAALDAAEVRKVSGVVLAAVVFPAGDDGNAGSVGWGWSDGR